MTFPEHLLKLRKERNIEQTEIAAALGVSLRTYQYYEYGERDPQLQTVIAMAKFYGLSLDELVFGE